MKKLLLLSILLFIASLSMAQSFSIRGNVKDHNQCLHKPIIGAMVMLSKTNDNSLYVAKTDSLGNYYFDSTKIKANILYLVYVDAMGIRESCCAYGRSKNDTISTVGVNSSKVFNVDFEMENHMDYFGGPKILFAYKDKSINGTGNDIMFCELMQLFKDNPSLGIELDGHCSPDEHCINKKKLSLLRANACRDYLISQGIDLARLKTKGWGSSQPQYSSDAISKMKTKQEKEKAYQEDRRVDIRVLQLDFVPKGGYSHQDSLQIKKLKDFENSYKGVEQH